MRSYESRLLPILSAVMGLGSFTEPVWSASYEGLSASRACMERLLSRRFDVARLKTEERMAYEYLRSLPEGAILRVTPPAGITAFAARYLGVSHSYHEHVELLQHQDVAFVLFRQLSPDGQQLAGTYMTALKQIAPPGGGATKTIVEILD